MIRWMLVITSVCVSLITRWELRCYDELRTHEHRIAEVIGIQSETKTILPRWISFEQKEKTKTGDPQIFQATLSKRERLFTAVVIFLRTQQFRRSEATPNLNHLVSVCLENILSGKWLLPYPAYFSEKPTRRLRARRTPAGFHHRRSWYISAGVSRRLLCAKPDTL